MNYIHHMLFMMFTKSLSAVVIQMEMAVGDVLVYVVAHSHVLILAVQGILVVVEACNKAPFSYEGNYL